MASNRVDTDTSFARAHFTTTDPDEAIGYIGAEYTQHQPLHRVDPAGFHFSVRSLRLGNVRMDHIRYEARVRSQNRGMAVFSAFEVLAGPLSVRVGRTRADFVAGEIGTNIPHADFWCELDGLHVRYFEIPLVEVAEAASILSGMEPSQYQVRAMTPRSVSLARYWRRISAAVTRESFGADSALTEPLVVAGMSRVLATAAAGVFASNATTGDYRPGVGMVKPAVVARALAFVDAHCHEPITVGMIADAAGVGPRALEYAFRRHQECTPMQYLQRVRLDRAHRDLQAADPKRGASVAAIAARWGFRNARSFAASYRQIYQKAPSTTLRT